MVVLEAFCYNPSSYAYCVIVKYNLQVICNVIAGHDKLRLDFLRVSKLVFVKRGFAKMTFNHIISPYRTDGSFAVNDVPSGSYVVEIVSPSIRFDPVRVDITSKGKMRYLAFLILLPSNMSIHEALC